jgi:sec-independent protein translocase protein TatA
LKPENESIGVFGRRSLKENTMVDATQHALAFLTMPGHWEWLIVLVIALLIFGKRLPELARSVGKSLTEFKKGINEAKESTDDVADDVKKIKGDVVNDAKQASGLNDTDPTR